MIKQIFSYIRAAIIESLVMLFFLITFPFKLKNRPHKATESFPIILVHGFMHNSSAWRWLRYELEHNNYGPVYTINLGGLDQNIEQHAARVDRLIDEIRSETGARKVQLVGHSMGGLVATWVASYRPHHVAKVITLGSPMEGTRVASIVKWSSPMQMRVGSPFLTELKNHAETLTMVPFVHIASDADQIIIPHDSGVPSFTPDSKRVWVDGLGHFSLLLSNRIFAILKSELIKLHSRNGFNS